MMDPRVRALIANLKELQHKYDRLEDRVSVMEENTCNHESRLEDCEKAIEKLEDEVDEY